MSFYLFYYNVNYIIIMQILQYVFYSNNINQIIIKFNQLLKMPTSKTASPTI